MSFKYNKDNKSATDRRLARFVTKVTDPLLVGGYFFLCIFIIATNNMAMPIMIENSSYVEMFPTSFTMRFGFFTIIAVVTAVANRLPCLYGSTIRL